MYRWLIQPPVITGPQLAANATSNNKESQLDSFVVIVASTN